MLVLRMFVTFVVADEKGNLKAQVQSFLIKSGEKKILVDTCNGNSKPRRDLKEWSNLKTDFLTTLQETGFTFSDIDIVVCTHLHCDHVGWNTRWEGGVWIPTFSNAKYLFVKEEYDYWKQKPQKEIGDDKTAFDDSVFPIMNAGRAIISGDVFHHPCQIARPEWMADGDTYPERALASRKKLLEEIADTNTLVIGSHFANPVAGLVVRSKDGFVFKV
ncbi:MBL fold metallo-hydrolase [Candidatus Roizmanbacteria bacterium]|nr:MBL fold metallo-hydrolase [Candidatus Roizmanbacteria bacterium]